MAAAFHNFVDGILIAAAFLWKTPEVGHRHRWPSSPTRFRRKSGLPDPAALRAIAGQGAGIQPVVQPGDAGRYAGLFCLSELTEWIPSLLGLAAASMIYVAVADLIPGLHKRTELKATVQQVLLIVLGIASIAIGAGAGRRVIRLLAEFKARPPLCPQLSASLRFLLGHHFVTLSLTPDARSGKVEQQAAGQGAVEQEEMIPDRMVGSLAATRMVT